MIQLTNNTPHHFIIIGSGGTGAYLLRHLLRLVASRDVPHHITIVDGDNVEEKNLTRQDFTHKDLGHNKARSLYRRYTEEYPDLKEQIHLAPAFVQTQEDLGQLIHFVPNTTPLIIGCVDNHSSRFLIQTMVEAEDTPILWLDTGNTERTGQVVLGTRHIDTLVPDTAKDLFDIKDFQTVIEAFPDSFDPKLNDNPGAQSCAVEQVSSPQNIAANIMNATAAFGLLNKLMAGEVITHNCIQFDSINLTMKGESYVM